MANKTPLRLSELVKQYPYSGQQATSPDVDAIPLLPRPRFSTRRFDALFVRIDTQVSFNAKQPARDRPIDLISEALQATSSSDATFIDEANTIWEDIKKRVSEDTQERDAYPTLTRVLDDETLRIISLVPVDPSDKAVTPISSTESDSTTTPIARPSNPRTRSPSAGQGASNGKPAGPLGGSPSQTSFTNWNDFSVVGFGETLVPTDLAVNLEADAEVTSPPAVPSSSSPKKRRNTGSRRVSTDGAVATKDVERGREGVPQEVKKPLLTRVDIIQIDEAFVDFWADALLDPISSSWPSFIVCQLKPGVWKVNLLVIEHSYSNPPPPPPPPIPASQNEKRAGSPRPSVSSTGAGRKSFALSPTLKRFSFFTAQGQKDADASPKAAAKKGGRAAVSKTPRIGEMGEVLPEEPAPAPVTHTVPEVKPKEAELPPVPVVPATPVTTAEDLPPAAIEPVKTEDNTVEKPSAITSSAISIPTDEGASHPGDKALPPAPEEVALTGSAPGPQVALSSNEPATLAEASISQLTGATSAPEDVAESERVQGKPVE